MEIYTSLDEQEADSSRNQNVKNQWCNLPHVLLSKISKDFGLIDLMCFRLVCKDWKYAFSEALSLIEFESEPLFLLYEKGNPQCSVVNNNRHRSCIMNLPEMAAATCLASHAGWLLLLSNADIFFFCPFTSTRIDLPKCPLISEQSRAAISSPPTHQNCTVVVFNREISKIKATLCLIRRGEHEWIHQEFWCPLSHFGKVRGATYHDFSYFPEGAFHFLDTSRLAIFDADAIKRRSGYHKPMLPGISRKKKYNKLNFSVCKDYFKRRSPVLRILLGIEEPVSISIRGTMVTKNGAKDQLIQDESYTYICKRGRGCESRQLKGVWIQPIFDQKSLYQRWSSG